MSARPSLVIPLLYVDISGRAGGATSSLRVLLGGLDRSSFRPMLLFGDRGNAGAWGPDEVLACSFAGFHNYDFFPATASFRWLTQCVRFVVRLPFDVVRLTIVLAHHKPSVVHLNGGQMIAPGIAARLLGIPVVWHIRELVTENFFGSLQRHVYRSCADIIVAPSHAVASRLPHCGDVRVIGNAVRPQVVSPEDVDQFRRAHGLQESDIVLLLLAHDLSPAKGYLFLADVADRLSDLAHVKFLLAGNTHGMNPQHCGDSLKGWRGRGRRSDALAVMRRWRDHSAAGRAVFPGHVQAELALHASTIVVCPNLVGEPFGRSVIEAAHAGRPAMASDLPALNEQITNGADGWLVPAGEVEAWERLIRRLAAHREEIVAMDLTTLRARSGAMLHASGIMALYDEVLEGSD